MSDNSAIEWTDATWNPVRGCTAISPGCAHCYAETFSERFRGVKDHPYEQGFDLRLVPAKVREPLSWTRPRRVFVNSMSDLFQDGVPETFILDIYSTMQEVHWHTYQVLTKRHERARDVLRWVERKFADAGQAFPLPNVWQGVSVENQEWADERIPVLMQTPAAKRFISAEPLLGPIDIVGQLVGPCARCGMSDLECAALRSEAGGDDGACCPLCRHHNSLDWVIVGGESGAGARPFDVAWARDIVKQCRGAYVPVFVKQFGARPYDGAAAEPTGNFRTDPDTGRRQYQVKMNALGLRHKKGGDMGEWPDDLRVREFPE